jgi:formiminoglutamase
VEQDLASPFLARLDTDWWVDRLYDFAADLGATIVRTAVSRTVIDVNRDPGEADAGPEQTRVTTGLCPLTTFDGRALYQPGREPAPGIIEARRRLYHEPFHYALAAEVARLRALHPTVVLLDCHAIRSRVQTLLAERLHLFNIGTNGGTSCSTALTFAVARECAASGRSYITNGHFKGGYIVRRHAQPDHGVHTLQLNLACRGYLHEPEEPLSEDNWPVFYDPYFAEPMCQILRRILVQCLKFAQSR